MDVMRFKKLPLVIFFILYFSFFSVYWYPVKQAEAALPAVVAGWLARKGLMKAGQHVGIAVATRAGVHFSNSPAAQRAYTAWFQRSGAAQVAMEGARKVAPGSRAGWEKWLIGLNVGHLLNLTHTMYTDIHSLITGNGGNLPIEYAFGDFYIGEETISAYFGAIANPVTNFPTDIVLEWGGTPLLNPVHTLTEFKSCQVMKNDSTDLKKLVLRNTKYLVWQIWLVCCAW